MPRHKRTVKTKHQVLGKTQGIIDLHFHGAFGIDLMTASAEQLNELSERLWEHGIAGFCPTTLSASRSELLRVVTKLGHWIRSKSAKGAIPIGIHLEGPFINPAACGAHPPNILRTLTLKEIEELWEASQKTLKILTVAPETLDPDTCVTLCKWCKKNKVILSLGHSKASQEEAETAFKLGFSGVTHAWNALNFHHRAAGVLGAAIGRKNVYLELIIDQIHVAPTVIRWTLNQHGSHTCFVSDCAPAAAMSSGNYYPFGNLKVEFRDGACRLPEGHLAGGGLLLGQAFGRWVVTEAKLTDQTQKAVFSKHYNKLTTEPLVALQLGKGPVFTRLKKMKIQWVFEGQFLTPKPL